MSKTLFTGSSLLGNSDAKIRCVNFPRLELENQLEDKKEVRCSLTCQPVLSFQFCGFFNFFYKEKWKRYPWTRTPLLSVVRLFDIYLLLLRKGVVL